MSDDEENCASEKYKECWEAANKWLNGHAPDFVIEQLEELNTYIKYLQSIIDDRDAYIDLVENSIRKDPTNELAGKIVLLRSSGGRTMSIENGDMQICTPEEAAAFGFNIEGPIAFIWDIANKSMLCLGFNTLDAVWQADISDGDLFVYQMVDKDLHKIMNACRSMAETSHILKTLDNFDLHRLLETCGFKGV